VCQKECVPKVRACQRERCAKGKGVPKERVCQREGCDKLIASTAQSS
jgi:hypothetical protein